MINVFFDAAVVFRCGSLVPFEVERLSTNCDCILVVQICNDWLSNEVSWALVRLCFIESLFKTQTKVDLFVVVVNGN